MRQHDMKFDPNKWDEAIEEYNRKYESGEFDDSEEMTEDELRDYDAECGYFDDEDEDEDEDESEE